MAQTYIGAPIRRKEDRRFLTGEGQFVDDVKLPNMLHAAIVRSPHPHARILSIDSSVALKMDGVAGVITFQDIEDTPGFGGGEAHLDVRRGHNPPRSVNPGRRVPE